MLAQETAILLLIAMCLISQKGIAYPIDDQSLNKPFDWSKTSEEPEPRKTTSDSTTDTTIHSTVHHHRTNADYFLTDEVNFSPQNKGMVLHHIPQQLNAFNRTKYRIFYNTLGDVIQSTSLFPIEINVPDMLSAMWGYMIVPIINRWQQKPQQQQQDQQQQQQQQQQTQEQHPPQLALGNPEQEQEQEQMNEQTQESIPLPMTKQLIKLLYNVNKPVSIYP